MLRGIARVALIITGFVPQQIPPDQSVTYSDFIIPLSGETLKARVSAVAAVVYCEILHSTPELTPAPNPWPPELVAARPGLLTPFVVTRHEVKVLDVLKSSTLLPNNSKSVYIVQPAGTAEWHGRSVTVDSGFQRIFAPGERYVLLLNTEDANESLSVLPFDVFRVDARGIVHAATGPYQKPFHGAPVDTLLTAIRAAVQ
jgi:hypothetical protein